VAPLKPGAPAVDEQVGELLAAGGEHLQVALGHWGEGAESTGEPEVISQTCRSWISTTLVHERLANGVGVDALWGGFEEDARGRLHEPVPQPTNRPAISSETIGSARGWS